MCTNMNCPVIAFDIHVHLMKFYFNINRYLITKDSISVLIETLHVCTQSLQTEPNPAVYQSVTELFRTLRNSCADCSKNQDIISEFPGCFCDISVVIRALTDRNIREDDREQVIVLLRCLVQFLGNSVTKHVVNQGHVTTHNLQYFRFVVFTICTCMFKPRLKKVGHISSLRQLVQHSLENA